MTEILCTLRLSTRKERILFHLKTKCLALLLCGAVLLSCLAPAFAAEADGGVEPPSQTDQSDEPIESEPIESELSTEEPAQTEETEEPPTESESADPAPEPEQEDQADPEADSAPSEESEADEPEQTETPVSLKKAILKAAAAIYTFKTLVSSSQSSSSNNYLNYTGGSGTHAVPVHQVATDGSTYWAYCADMRHDWPGSDYSNYTKKALPSSGLYQVQKVAMQLGFGDNNLSRLKTMFGYDLNNYEAYQATQVVLWASTVWEEQWHYINSAPSTIRKGVTDYWQVKTASGKSKNAYDFALALADAVQAVYKDGIGCDISVAENKTSVDSKQFKIVVNPKNYYGGYSATISGVPSGATLTSSDSNVTVTKASAFTSTASGGTDTLYLTVPKTASAQSITVTVTVTPVIRKYSSNSAVAFLEAASSSYQDILYSAGTQSTAPVSKMATLSIPRSPNGQVTITKLDADTKKPVPGVVFELYQFDGKNYVTTGKKASSDSKGIVTFSDLSYNATNLGRYRVFEVSSDTHEVWTDRYVCWFSLASGLWYSYESATSVQKTGTATANNSGNYDFTFSFTAYNKEIVRDGSLTIQKQDGAGKALSGVSFIVTDSKGKALSFSKGSDGIYLPTTSGSTTLTTDSRGQIKVNKLPFDSYLVTEVKTSGAGVSLLPTSFPVTLPVQDSSGAEQVDLTYTVVDGGNFTLPRTGGAGHLASVFCGLAVLTALLLVSRKSQHKGVA